MDVQKYINVPNDEKWWQKDSDKPNYLNDVPIAMNETDNVKNSEFVELNNKIDKLVYDFISQHDIPNAWAFYYSIDDLQSLKEHGIECAYCDGGIRIVDKEHKSIAISI